ncbi:MAG: hypothetical protein U1E17_01555 [Geminicoccaceae bacterium]
MALSLGERMSRKRAARCGAQAGCQPVGGLAAEPALGCLLVPLLQREMVQDGGQASAGSPSPTSSRNAVIHRPAEQRVAREPQGLTGCCASGGDDRGDVALNEPGLRLGPQEAIDGPQTIAPWQVAQPSPSWACSAAELPAIGKDAAQKALHSEVVLDPHLFRRRGAGGPSNRTLAWYQISTHEQQP